MSTTAADVWDILHELAQSQRETDLKFQDTDRKFQDTDRKFQDTDLKFQDTDRKLKEVTNSIGRLGNRLGDFIEDAVRPSAVRLFKQRGLEVHEVHENVSAQRGNEGIEVDLLVVNETEVVVIECKSNLKQEDVDQHLERLAKVKRLLPAYSAACIMGAVAGMVIPDNVARYAYRKGLFVIGQSGDHLEIRNDGSFTPAVW